ncbi:MAG: outer membrane protein assembly factor BamD [Deltaproteobacteria bacterium]|nr:outer membrane protein assembly factor BamD [Deltaproteobacteria bacterium]MDZ4344428.1 outer membrane protein assembly factor BamD [Candidatus Binatia bacterium]
MIVKVILFVLLFGAGAAGCSSVSLPSLPSLPSVPWFASAPKADATEQQLLDEGTRYFNEKKYVRAIDAFTKIKTDYPFSPALTDVTLKIADAYYLNEQYPEAINAFKEFQSMHPTNENIPFVTYRLGQSHFDQFSSTDRDQKNTEIAKGYFETVVAKYPKSPYAAEAKQKLAKANGYLSEHDFNIATFYFQQEKYPAARDRFEEIVRRYRGTPTAVKSLFYLGESYRRERNSVKAALAYEALIQHYPESKFAAEAKTQLAQLGKEKNDPLAMLLMRDRRPTASATPEKTETADAKLRDIEFIAKKEVVFEEPGDEKNIFLRVVDKINPFSDSGKKTDDKPPENWQELLAKKKAAQKEEPASWWSSINPFSSRDSNDSKLKKGDSSKDQQLVNQIDDSLKQKGVDAKDQVAALKPPAAALPELPAPPAQTMDTGKLIGEIDSNLKKSGTEVKELTPPKAAEGLNNPAALEALAAKRKAGESEPQNTNAAGLLSSIDQKLQKQGVGPAGFEPPPVAPAGKEPTAKNDPQRKVEIEPKFALEKGPLFLNPTETQGIAGTTPEPVTQGKNTESTEQKPATRDISKALVKGPTQPQASTAAKQEEEKKPAAGQDPENKGTFDQLRQDLDSIGKILNPFRW